jgi:hypothetical protein
MSGSTAGGAGTSAAALTSAAQIKPVATTMAQTMMAWPRLVTCRADILDLEGYPISSGGSTTIHG